MPEFSIIIPVYNIEQYIKECLDSVFNQSFKDFEVIVVNDGTKDNSMDIVKNYDVKIINQKNKGLSSARNHGVQLAKGKYILFLDSDDYLEKDTLKEIHKSLKNNPDIVRFQIQEVNENHKITEFKEEAFNSLSGEEAFKKIVNYHFVENAWCYAIKRSYYLQEKYTFKEGTIHEDFGLIPLVIIKAPIVNSINYIGYNYRIRNGSIMNNNDYEKTKKKVNDFYAHYKYLVEEIDKTKINSKIFKSFIANSLLIKICELNKEDYKKYLKKIKKDKVIDNLLSDSIPRKLKKILVHISPKLVYKR